MIVIYNEYITIKAKYINKLNLIKTLSHIFYKYNLQIRLQYLDLSFTYNDTYNWGGVASEKTLRNWQRVSNIRTQLNTTSNIVLGISPTSATNHGQWFFSDGLMLIDLTETFGAGNEPTKEWCDQNIPYFTGTISLKLNK